MSRGADGFVPGPRCIVAPTGRGSLDGLSFAVKDLLDVAGWPTGAGNPDWRDTHPSANATAPVIERVLGAGARLIGKTITDELAFSLEGENEHFGTPVNPRCPERLPGGSSSGSAVAVSGGAVDFALGTDTGGSVRIPASFCGIAGFRPSHGRIPLVGVVPFAPSYDTVGWMARTGTMIDRVGRQLLADWRELPPPTRFIVARDAMDAADVPVRAALSHTIARLGPMAEIDIFDGRRGDFLEAFWLVQGGEIWANLGAWITAVRPRFGAAIAARFEDARAISAGQFAAGQQMRHDLVRSLNRAVPPGAVLLLPTSPSLPLDKASGPPERARFYELALAYTSIAGHGGRPALSLPLGDSNGCPVGLSAVGWGGGDEALMALARSLYP